MDIQASPTPKKARYRIAELIKEIPNGLLTEEKEALATQLGVSIPQLNRIIRGGSDPSGSQLRIIAAYFGISVDDLYLPDEAIYEAN